MISVSRSDDRRLERLQVAHVLAVQVDVDEAVQPTLGRQELLAHLRVLPDEVAR